MTDCNAATLSDILWTIWPRIVGHYLICILTYVGEKLVASSEIAKLIQQVFKVEYRAGLWNQDLEYQLIWNCHTSAARNPQTTYGAPTWSWVSVDGGIHLSQHRKEEDWWKRVVVIRDCHIETQIGDTTIGIVNGYLRQSGWLITMQMDRAHERERHWELFTNGAW